MKSSAFVLLGIAFFLAACGGKSGENSPEPDTTQAPVAAAPATSTPVASAQSAAQEIDPCAVLSDEQVSEVLGRAVRSEIRIPGAQCSWYADGEDRAAFFVTIKDFRQAPQFAEKRFNPKNEPELSGIGQRAYLEKPQLGSGIVLNILTDAFVVHVGSSTSEDAAPLQDLAPIVLQQLP